MKNLIVLAILCLLTSGLLAQTPTKAASEKATIAPTPLQGATTIDAPNDPQTIILGKWKLKSVNDIEQLDGQALEGYISFDKEGTFEGVMMGEQSKGRYKVLNNNDQLQLQTIEEEVEEIVVIANLTHHILLIAAEDMEILFVK